MNIKAKNDRNQRELNSKQFTFSVKSSCTLQTFSDSMRTLAEISARAQDRFAYGFEQFPAQGSACSGKNCAAGCLENVEVLPRTCT